MFSLRMTIWCVWKAGDLTGAVIAIAVDLAARNARDVQDIDLFGGIFCCSHVRKLHLVEQLPTLLLADIPRARWVASLALYSPHVCSLQKSSTSWGIVLTLAFFSSLCSAVQLTDHVRAPWLGGRTISFLVRHCSGDKKYGATTDVLKMFANKPNKLQRWKCAVLNKLQRWKCTMSSRCKTPAKTTKGQPVSLSNRQHLCWIYGKSAKFLNKKAQTSSSF
jgi:hypothetical protein